MRCYARTLRSANLLTYLFDSDYKKAWTTWKKLQRKLEKLSDSEVAKRLDQLASFLEEVDAFKKDKKLCRVCGNYFKELETDFDSLLLVNDFGNTLSHQLSSLSNSQEIRSFLIQADLTKLEKASRLQNSEKFQSLVTFVNSLKLEKGFDEQQNWEELAAYYRTTSSVSMQIYEEFTSFGLQPLMPISAIPNLIQGIENLNSEKQKINASELINTLGYFYQEEKTDVERLEATTNFAKSVVQSQLPQSIQEKLFTLDAARVVEVIQAASRSLSSCLEKEAQYQQAFVQQGKPDAQAMFGSQYVTSLRLEQIVERLDRAVVASSDLPAWIGYH
jgi:hypothetical protein